MTPQILEILTELISRPSVNPRLAAPDDPAAGESRVTAWLCDFFQRQQWAWLTQMVQPGRANALAVVPGRADRVLLWEAHQDTVAAAGMDQPFAAVQRDGRIYGRGACDVKGGLAAILAAAVAAEAAAAPSQRPTLLVASTINEECGFTGVRALADLLQGGDQTSTAGLEGPLSAAELAKLRPQAAIVAEPTDLHVVAAHRGVVRWQARTAGRAAHSSRPEQGANAVYAMARVVQGVEQLHQELSTADAQVTDPLLAQCGPPTIAVTTIQGGVGANTVPDTAVIDIDRRISPGESPEEAYEAVKSALARRVELGECRLTHDPPWMQSTCLADEPSRQWAEQLAAVVRTTSPACQVVGVPYGTNAATLAAAGIPAAVFGPGSIQQAHTIDEYIEIAQLEAAVDVLTRIGSGEYEM